MIRSNPFITYLSLIFIFNILVYWSSPEVYPRYILMLVPLYFGVTTWFYLEKSDGFPVQKRIIEGALGVVLSLSVIIPVASFFMDLSHTVPNIQVYAVLLIAILGTFTWLYSKQKRYRIYWLVLALLVLRTGFDVIVLPVRHADSDETRARDLAREITLETQDKPLYFWWNPEVEPSPYYGKQVASYRFTYYLSTYRDSIIEITSDRRKDAYFISQGWAVKKENVQILQEFQPPGHDTPIVLFTFKNNAIR